MTARAAVCAELLTITACGSDDELARRLFLQGRMKLALPFALGLVLLAACGGGTGDDGPSIDAAGNIDGGGATCTLTSSITANASAKTVTGIGKVDCTSAANIQVETCVQWNPSGTFIDIMCVSKTNSNLLAKEALTVENLSSCGITAGRQFRARVNAMVNGTPKPEMVSAEIGCF